MENTQFSFSKCFDKHNFQELNEIDAHMLYRAVHFYIQKFQNTNGVFLDIGSNAGSFVKILHYFGIHSNIHCFEPHPVLHAKTKEIYPYINMNNYCLGNTDGTVDIYFPELSVGLSSIINRPVFSTLGQPINKMNVKCKTLDTYCKENNIDIVEFVKIDVEGGEKCIFEGATELLKNKKIKCGLFEIGQTLYDANTHEDEICNILIGYGYTINKDISGSDYLFYLS